jgi:hypothetical protein
MYYVVRTQYPPCQSALFCIPTYSVPPYIVGKYMVVYPVAAGCPDHLRHVAARTDHGLTETPVIRSILFP